MALLMNPCEQFLIEKEEGRTPEEKKRILEYIRSQRRKRRQSEMSNRIQKENEERERESRYHETLMHIQKVQIIEAEYVREQNNAFNSRSGGSRIRDRSVSYDETIFPPNERNALKLFIVLNRMFKRFYFKRLKSYVEAMNFFSETAIIRQFTEQFPDKQKPSSSKTERVKSPNQLDSPQKPISKEGLEDFIRM